MNQPCLACKSTNTMSALVDGTYYRGPMLICREENCGKVFGVGGRTLDDLVAEGKTRRKARKGQSRGRV